MPVQFVLSCNTGTFDVQLDFSCDYIFYVSASLKSSNRNHSIIVVIMSINYQLYEREVGGGKEGVLAGDDNERGRGHRAVGAWR